MSIYTLGISSFYHDSAAALIKDGIPVAAAQEERFSRIRHDSSFPREAIKFCLDAENISLGDISSVVYYEDSKQKFHRVISSFASAGVKGAMAFVRIFPEWVKWKRNVLLRIDNELAHLKRGVAPKTIASQHHRSHAASAFFPSPFKRAAVLCIDGVGEWQTTSIWRGNSNSLELINSIYYPHSVGLLYSTFTYYCGFKIDSGEYKLMGLAPYGSPVYANLIKSELINIRVDGSFTLNMDYFEFIRGEKMIGNKFEQLLGGPVRKPESPITQRHCDLAASVQKVTEEVVFGLAIAAMEQTGEKNLCLAGGVALNCVANGVLNRSGKFASIWIQPAAGDAGCALGAALDVSVSQSGRPHLQMNGDAMQGALLGPRFSDEEIENFLTKNNYHFEKFHDDFLYDEVANHLSNGSVVGWFNGRMEFGPRALGARSILADPRDPEMQKRINLKVKFRESFRPFAPSVLLEEVHNYFDMKEESPYMLIVSDVANHIKIEPQDNLIEIGITPGRMKKTHSKLPAITHVDFSARVQTVTEDSNLPFTKLLRSFKKKTGCSVLVNTSFNVRGEPIVCTPKNAYECFMRSEIDMLVLGSFILKRANQPKFKDEFDLRGEMVHD